MDSCVLAIGNFDGVHRGHAALVSHARVLAEAKGLPLNLLTFDPLPSEYFASLNRAENIDSHTGLVDVVDSEFYGKICTLDQRKAMLTHLGVDRVRVKVFDAALQAVSPEQFVELIVGQECAAVAVVVGSDFRFGHNRSGDIKMLKQLCEKHAIEYKIFSLQGDAAGLIADKSKYSSGCIRQALNRGELTLVNSYLGYSFQITGVVEHGDGRGVSLGFATANIVADLPLPNLRGVFVSSMRVAGKWLKSVTNIGIKPTFGGNILAFETHLLEQCKDDLYGSHLSVALHLKLRDEQRYADKNELIKQIKSDLKVTHNWHQNNQPVFMPVAASNA